MLVDVLDRSPRGQKDDQWNRADRHPAVDVAGRFVDITAGADHLAGVDELARAREIDRVDLAGVAVARDHRAGLEPEQLYAGVVVGGTAPDHLEGEARADRLPGECVDFGR